MLKKRIQSTLSEDYAARMKWNNNRASAVFPVILRQGCEVRILTLNYWRIKNNIQNINHRILYKSNLKVNIFYF